MSRSWLLRLLISLAAVGSLGAGPSPPDHVWSAAYEADPTATDAVSEGDDWVRALKIDIRQRGEPEIHWGSANSDDNGLLRLGSARCFVGTAAPTVIEQADYDNSGGAGTATLSDNATNSAPAERVGHGRCWLDTDGADGVAGTWDDDTLWVYDAANAWEQVTNGFDASQIYLRNSRNLVKNSSFEINDGTTTVPTYWALSATPTLAYSTTDVTEGDGDEIHITAAGAANEGISQNLVGLKASTTYLAVARAHATAGGDTCSLRTNNAFTEAAVTTTSDSAYEELVDTFVVDGAGATVTLILEADADGDICKFDRVGVFELGGITKHPAHTAASSWAAVYTDSDAFGGATVGDSELVLSDTFNTEAPNCYYRVTGQIEVTAIANARVEDTKIVQSLNGGADTTLIQISSANTLGASTVPIVWAGSALVANPTPGDTYQFKVEIDYADLGVDSATITSYLAVESVCPGD